MGQFGVLHWQWWQPPASAPDIANYLKYGGYQCWTASMVYKFFDKKFSGGAVTRVGTETLATRNKPAVISGIMLNQELSEQLQKTIIRKFEQC